jgi:hypothetical protein
MGWASGSDIARDMIESIQKNVKNTKIKRALYKDLIDTLVSSDWDTQDDVLDFDPDFDNVLYEKYPDWRPE